MSCKSQCPPTTGSKRKGSAIRAQEEESETSGATGGRSASRGAAGVLHGVPSVGRAPSQSTEDPVLAAVGEALSELVPHDRLALYETDGSSRMLRTRSSDPSAGEGTGETLAHYAAVVGRITETREPQLLNEVYVEGAGRAGAEAAPGVTESILAVPLLALDELKGVLCLGRKGVGRSFNVREFKLAMLFGDVAALAVENSEIRASLEAEVVTDHLTGLYNHRFFQERLSEEISRAHRRHTSVALILYDLDDFKRVNDSYGHQAGDRVLQSVASVSRETCRAEDVICRLGGEEFAIILPGSSIEEAAALAERVREGIRKVSLPPVGRVTVSLGVAEGPLHASSPRELITCADFALLEAKRTGKDRVHVYASEIFDAEPRAPRDRDAENGERATPTYGSGTGMSGRLAVLAARGEARSLAQLRMLQSLSTKLNRLNDVKKIGEAITAELRSLIDYHNCQVHLVDGDGETLVPVGFRGELFDYQMESFPALVSKVGHGIAGRVAETGEPYYTPNAREDAVAGGPMRGRGVDESILGVPLLAGERIIGTIVISKLGVDQFDDEDMRLLEGLASNAAVALENARLLERERETARETYLSTVAALANALEAKDEYTGSHARALAEMSVTVGQGMGLGPERLKWLELGALFHDIGKIGVPSEIIRKAGRLTAAERREMNRHPEIGEQILAHVPFLRPLLPIVRACHERWDGKGYPDGLAGEAIPLEARIIFVCDAFHAMTTNRPYRKALSQGEAVRRLRLASGTQFDPNVVTVFARVYGEGRIAHD